MKHLTLMRHAKSSWDNPALCDFDRPLNERGRNDLPTIASALAEKNLHPNALWVSASKRTRETAALIIKQLNIPLASVVYKEDIYEANALRLFTIIREAPDEVDELMLIGHNPGMSDIAWVLLSGERYNFPTSAVIRIALDYDHWASIEKYHGKLDFIISPH